jgi:hypothetical protein
MTTALRQRYRFPLSATPDLDFLLANVAESIQLTTSQYERAERSYEAVAAWLSAPGSALAPNSPKVYPQGSMALETTVKPLRTAEHDLDMVCQVSDGVWTAMGLYDAVHARLAQHPLYSGMLAKMNRCVRLEYRDDFHLDIIPAIARPGERGTNVDVPDRELRGWTPSNPKGYVAWFKTKSVQLLLEKVAKAEPLPPQRDAEEKPPLTVVVQLVKRARDVVFSGHDDAPRSILLTTLAGQHYDGDFSVAATTVKVLRAVERDIAAAAPGEIVVVNPSNPAENFTDSMKGNRYEAFSTFVTWLRAKVDELSSLDGELLYGALEKLFGVAPVHSALQKYAELQKSRRDQGTLTTSSAGVSVIAPAVGGARVPKHTYFGD